MELNKLSAATELDSTDSDEFGRISVEELPGLIPESAPVEESVSLPQLAQKKLATDKQPKRKNLRIFIPTSF